MKNFDPSGMIVTYNFVIGVLTMLSSEKLGAAAGKISGGFGKNINRVTYISLFTFGAAIAFVSGVTYIAFHLLRIGV